MITQLYLAAAGTAHEAATEAGNPISELAGQFHVEWPFLIAQMINFCIVAFVLYRFAFKPVLATIEQRQQKIADGLQYAEEMKSKLAEAEKKEAETLKNAQLEAQKIVNEARESAKAFAEKQSQEAVKKAEEIVKKAEAAIDQERKSMLAEVRQEIAALVVLTTGKVLRKELSDQERSTYSESAARELTSVDS